MNLRRTSLLFILVIATAGLQALAATATRQKEAVTVPFAIDLVSSDCDASTQSEFECESTAATRAENQLAKDFQYLSSLAASRSKKSVVFFKLGQIAFKNYVQLNCESESHDAFGASLADVLMQKCRRETFLNRRHLFEQVAEPQPLGNSAERIFGRPICGTFNDRSKATAVSAVARMSDTEALRKKLDQIGTKAALSGTYQPSVAKLLRSVHEEAERQSRYDANFTCLGIWEGFCPDSALTQPDSEMEVRTEWLSRCQTQIQSAFYKRASSRLRMLKSE